MRIQCGFVVWAAIVCYAVSLAGTFTLHPFHHHHSHGNPHHDSLVAQDPGASRDLVALHESDDHHTHEHHSHDHDSHDHDSHDHDSGPHAIRHETDLDADFGHSHREESSQHRHDEEDCPYCQFLALAVIIAEPVGLPESFEVVATLNDRNQVSAQFAAHCLPPARGPPTA